MVAAATILVNDAHKIEQGYYNGHVEGFAITVGLMEYISGWP